MWSWIEFEVKTNHSYWNVNEWIETEVNKQTKHNRYETTVQLVLNQVFEYFIDSLTEFLFNCELSLPKWSSHSSMCKTQSNQRCKIKVQTMWFLCAFPHWIDLMFLYMWVGWCECEDVIKSYLIHKQHNNKTTNKRTAQYQMKMQTMILYYLFNNTTRSCRSVRKI
jgi:hypothetical protein